MMQNLFAQAVQKNLFTSLDIHLGSFLSQKADLSVVQKDRLHFLVAWLSAETRAGHVCIDITQLSQYRLFYGREADLTAQFWSQLGHPELNDWLSALSAPIVVSDGQTNTPLVLYGYQLYFQRMWLDENKIAEYFLQASTEKQGNIALLSPVLNQLFPVLTPDVDWQKIAVAIALTRKIAIISGGPGTGKTTTVAKLLAALLSEHSHDESHSLRIVAAAPTGKAAARLTESLNNAVTQLSLDDALHRLLPKEAMTLHRLLGAQPNSRQFVYHQDNPLHLDILIIDEASMVDLSMMARVIEALPSDARLILLGDREQLSSVEAGAVLGDLCSFAEKGYSVERAAEVAQLTGYQLPSVTMAPAISDSICLLHKSYRFGASSGIGLLAESVKTGNVTQTKQLLMHHQYADIDFHLLITEQDYQQVIAQCVAGYRTYLDYLRTDNPEAKLALDYFSRFRLLCALREGFFGVQGLNRQIERGLAEQRLIHLTQHDEWYIGRPVMILKNSAGLGLYNGDIGITLYTDKNRTKKRVYFQLADGSVQGFSPYRLPEHETAFAMTVHKSQGSEFEHTCFILPNEYSPLLTRSLLYTAITRAKQKITLFATESILEKTIQSQVERQSGLIKLLNKAH